MSTGSDIRDLMQRLPLPLAQLVRRVVNAKSAIERHQHAFYLAEASLKLAAALRIGLWLFRGLEPGGRLAKRLAGLVMPSLGRWCEFLREVDRALGTLPDADALPVVASRAELAQKLPESSAVSRFAQRGVEVSVFSAKSTAQPLRRGVLGFFELIVAYRNAVMGHGAHRSSSFYEDFSDLLLDAAAETLAISGLFDGLVLAVPRLELDEDRSGTHLHWKELVGLAGVPLGRQVEGVVAGQLYFIGANGHIPLHPLVVYQEDDLGRERIGFLNRTVARKRQRSDGTMVEVSQVDYLDYATGRVLEGIDAQAEVQALLLRLKRKPEMPEQGQQVGTRRGGFVRSEPSSPSAQPQQMVDPVAATAPSQPALGAPRADEQQVPPTEQAKERAGEIIADKYQLVRLLGEGAMGVVYEAQHIELKRPVALKLLHRDLAQAASAVERFRREAQQAASTRHPGIVDVIDFGTNSDGACYLVMELLEGEPLDSLAARGPMPIDQAVQITIDALDALAAAHEKGIVHRDLKPQNIFVSFPSTGDCTIKIVDFGIAKLLRAEQHMTQKGSLLGTPAYMSLEQIRDPGNVDARTDIYAMGVTLFELLTGEPPLIRESVVDLIAALLEGKAKRRPGELRSAVPDWLDDIVCQALAPDKQDRYSSALAMRRALQQGLANHTDELDAIRSETGGGQRESEPLAESESQLELKSDGDIPKAADKPPEASADACTGDGPLPVPAKRSSRRLVVISLVSVVVLAGIGMGWHLVTGNPPVVPKPVEPEKKPAAPTVPEPYSLSAITPLQEACDQGLIIVATTPRATKNRWTWIRQALLANEQFESTSKWQTPPPGKVAFGEFNTGVNRALVARCDVPTCNHFTAMVKAVVPKSRPQLYCDRIPSLESHKPRPVELKSPGPARDGLPTDDDIEGQCARLRACMIAVDRSTPSDWGEKCAKSPSEFELACARRYPCAKVVACLNK